MAKYFLELDDLEQGWSRRLLHKATMVRILNIWTQDTHGEVRYYNNTICMLEL